MFVRVWEYEVGAQLFERSGAAFVGTELYRGLGDPRRYLTVDRFTSARERG